MGNHVDPQSRRFALAQAAIEQIDLSGNLREQRIERFIEDLEPGDLGVAQIDDDAGAIRSLDPRLAQRVAQPDPARLAPALLPVFCASDIVFGPCCLPEPR